MKGQRIQLMDAARGLCIILMICHHWAFDLYLFGFIPDSLIFGSWLTDFLSPLFASLFIFISGIASRFSRSNVKRGIKTMGAAILVTIGTYIVGEPVIFGVLHFYGVAMVLYGLLGKHLDKLPQKLAPILWAVLFVLCYVFLLHRSYDVPGLWWLGIHAPDFYSSDYYPLLPWIFMFLLGTWAGTYVKEGRLPDWFYDTKVKFLPKVGSYGLIIYLVHQPIGYGLAWCLAKLLR